VRVLIAPDSFKDALAAPEVAAALAAGVRAAQPAAESRCLPLGDGGEGTGQVLATALDAFERRAEVNGPRGDPQSAAWWRTRDGATAIIEMATASGLMLLKPHDRDPLQTTTHGTGELIAAALAGGCQRILVAIGGSATVDGGAGCLQALGFTLIDAHGQPISAPATGGTLERIARIAPPASLPNVQIDVLCDVDHSLLGPRGAAPVFGPQKGADPAGVAALERGLTHWAHVLSEATGRDARDDVGAGAAGGLAFGLATGLGANLRTGFDEVATRVGLERELAGCDICLTGEGRIDDQTAGGKVVSGVARLARTAGVPVIAFVGAARLAAGQTLDDLAAAVGLQSIELITPPGATGETALAQTAANLRRTAADVLSRVQPGGATP
jgi:glycerate kinase